MEPNVAFGVSWRQAGEIVNDDQSDPPSHCGILPPLSFGLARNDFLTSSLAQFPPVNWQSGLCAWQPVQTVASADSGLVMPQEGM